MPKIELVYVTLSSTRGLVHGIRALEGASSVQPAPLTYWEPSGGVLLTA